MTETRPPREPSPLTISLLLTSLLLLGWAGAWAQVSPGPLAAAHGAMDGSLQCLKCHGPGGSKTGMDEKCLACHKEIAAMRTAKRGQHATVMDKNCASCHPDHGGTNFQLIVWEEGTPEKFDHKRAGFLLEGKHAEIKCRDCHKTELQKSDVVPLMLVKDHARSWLGMKTACADCHADPHRGQLGTKCATCHAQDKFKPAGGFDHAKTSYPLTGKHAKVECAKCHASPAVSPGPDAKGQPIAQWKPLQHGDCLSCHKDPHNGTFKGACAKCHVTDDFHQVSKTAFNHDTTHYPLRGKHAAVACAKCHDPKTAFGQKPKFARCLDCHRDPHNGTATLATKVVDCASCHNVQAFDASIYTVAMHQKSAYPLEGRHTTADCSLCHVKVVAGTPLAVKLGTARVVMRPRKGACVDCHADPHAGRFRPTGARPHKADCLACHTMLVFHPSKYDNRMHVDCVFPLEGAHMATPCQGCHDELKAPPSRSSLASAAAGMRPLHFDNPRRVCVDCHKSPHGDQFAARKDKGACDGCHGADAFAPAVKFDHNRDSSFGLEGAHSKTLCANCHVPKKGVDGKPFVLYRPTPKKCEDCHGGTVPDTTSVKKKQSGWTPPRMEARGWLSLAFPEVARGTH